MEGTVVPFLFCEALAIGCAKWSGLLGPRMKSFTETSTKKYFLDGSVYYAEMYGPKF